MPVRSSRTESGRQAPRDALPMGGNTVRRPDRSWIDHRASVCRALFDRSGCRTCPECGAIVDEPEPAHSPRCEVDA